MSDYKKNSIVKNWLPPILYEKLLFLNDYIKYKKETSKEILSRNSEIAGYRKSDTAYLIATGPSLKEQDLSLLIGKDVFTLSNFFEHELINELNPIFHFFAQIHPPLVPENIIEWFKKSDSKLPSSTNIIMGYDNVPIVESNKLFKEREVFYLYYFAHTGVQLDLTKFIMGPQTIPLMALPTLISMGYKNIVLLGCDHNVLKDFGNTIEHFTNKDDRLSASDTKAWSPIIDAHWASVNVFIQYKKIKKYLIKNNYSTRIINTSNTSWLDIFEFQKIEDTIKLK